jgi:benzylsuccinate CoA-transferase BbsF subunit
MTLPLTDVRVIDFTWLGAGPYTTRVLADHGADVIRVESSQRLDRLRILPPFRDGDRKDSVNRSGYYADRNSNKRGVTINLKQPDGLDLVRRLIAVGDVVASNFTPGTMTKLGLGYDAVRAIRPDVIYLEMGMQGATGPDSTLVGYGQTVSALTGLHHLSGLPGQAPVGTGTNYPDHVAAPAHSAFAVLAALRHRRRTGEGTHIDMAQTESMIGLLGPAVLDYTVNGRSQGPQGNRASYAAPQGVYPVAGDDRWIAISVLIDAHWAALCDVLGAPDLRDDPRFTTFVGRQHTHDDLDKILGRLTSVRDRDELARALQAVGIPAGPMETYQDLLESDEQLRARGHFVVLDHPETGPSAYNAPPFRLSGVPEPIMRTPAPLLGQHTHEVLTEVLGIDDAELDRLAAAEVLT